MSSSANEVKILYKVNDGIITNLDVEQEVNYLVSLNQNLSQLSNEQIISNAQKSLIREKIKKDNIEKFYDVNYETAIRSEKLMNIIENFRKNIGFNSSIEFENYLKSKEIDFDKLKKKFVIEQLWNTLIVEKYRNSIKIDKDKINNKLDLIILNN